MTPITPALGHIPEGFYQGKVWHAFAYDLPLPPSVWDLYVGTGPRRRMSPAYADWRWLARYEEQLTDGNAVPRIFPDFAGVPARFLLDIDLGHFPDAKGDCDNRIKGVQDYLSTMIGIDDRRCDWVSAYRSTSHDGTRAYVMLVVTQEVGDAENH